jgi:hypothetical protein
MVLFSKFFWIKLDKQREMENFTKIINENSYDIPAHYFKTLALWRIFTRPQFVFIRYLGPIVLVIWSRSPGSLEADGIRNSIGNSADLSSKL